MNREYTVAEFRRVADYLLEHVPGVTIATVRCVYVCMCVCLRDVARRPGCALTHPTTTRARRTLLGSSSHKCP